MTDQSRCRSCGQIIDWAITENGRRMPLDPDPVDTGNLVVVDGVAHPPRLGDEELPRRVSHFATCPDAGVHRKRGRR